jgi:DNA polymerase III epsilon subunit-like protein
MIPSPPSLPSRSSQSCGWVDVLKSVGWPTDVIVLDFETFFSKEYSLSKLATICYIEDKRFEEIGVAVLVIDGNAPFAPRQATFWPNVKEELAWLQNRYGESLERCTVVIQNARFDGTILTRKYGVTPPFVVDTVALSRHLDARNKHNLADLCERWNLPPKGNTMQFEGLHWDAMTPEQRDAMASYACNDAEREADLFTILLPKLTRPQVELPLIRHTLRLYWLPDLEFDFEEAERLIARMEAQVKLDTDPVGATPKEISGMNSFVALLGEALAETGEQVAFKQGKKKMLAALAKDDDAVKQYKRHRNPRVRALIKARQAVKSWPLHIRRLRSMIAQARAAGGRLCNPLNYYGAHTGRWSGGEKINTCNLPTRETA